MAGLVGKIPAIPTLGAQGVTLRNAVYNVVMKRTSTYVGAILVCAMVAENTLDSAVDTAWRVSNKGVRRPFCPASLFAREYFRLQSRRCRALSLRDWS